MNKGFEKRHIPWNKGLIGKEYKSHYKNGFKGIYKKGHIPDNPVKKGEHRGLETEFSRGIIPWNTGKKLDKEFRNKISKANRGKKNPNWKGGINSLMKRIRLCFKYRQWRSDVFMRDNLTCQKCNIRGGKLNAHHIKSISSILQYYEITTLEKALECEELWNVNNGITLHKKCHRNIHFKNKDYLLVLDGV